MSSRVSLATRDPESRVARYKDAIRMILHIVKRSEWEQAASRGSYEPPSLGAEGFVHCSTIEQLLDTANRFYRGQKDLIVLCIDESRLNAPLKFETPSMPAHEKRDGLFPHIHGALNLEAVTTVIEFPCADDGTFQMPEELPGR